MCQAGRCTRPLVIGEGVPRPKRWFGKAGQLCEAGGWRGGCQEVLCACAKHAALQAAAYDLGVRLSAFWWLAPVVVALLCMCSAVKRVNGGVRAWAGFGGVACRGRARGPARRCAAVWPCLAGYQIYFSRESLFQHIFYHMSVGSALYAYRTFLAGPNSFLGAACRCHTALPVCRGQRGGGAAYRPYTGIIIRGDGGWGW